MKMEIQKLKVRICYNIGPPMPREDPAIFPVLICLRHYNPVVCLMLTWTLDSGRLILRATSSLMKMSGYRVLANSASRTSSCALVKVVLSRRCFRGLPEYSHQSLGLPSPVMWTAKCYVLFRHQSNYDKLRDTNTPKRHYVGRLNK